MAGQSSPITHATPVPVTTTSRARFLEGFVICVGANPGGELPPFYAGYDEIS
jgi:hypothetical protein